MTVPAILDSRGQPMQALDTVTEAIQTAGGAHNAYRNGPLGQMFGSMLAHAAYAASGLLQKVIEIPAQDRVREWRDWNADSDAITALEAEEKRLGLRQKVRQAEVLRGIGGGALILSIDKRHGQTNEPARPERLAPTDLIAVNVVSRWQVTLVDIDTNIASPTYGEPRMFRVNAGQSGQQDIHPSRVIPFRGEFIPDATALSGEDAYWGRSRLAKVWTAVERSDNAQTWFAALVKKAKLLRIGIPGLTDFTSTPQGEARLIKRMGAIASGESMLGATVYDTSGKDGASETITDYQVKWDGIPALMDAFDQRVAAVADIPFTRLMGRSPAGMNATGEHDAENWAAAVAAGQELELRPCLERLDPFLLASAGVAPDGVWWTFTSIYKPSAKEEADRFKTTADAIKLVAEVNAIPERAFNAGVQSVIEAAGWMPGMVPELAKLSEDARFGLSVEPDDTDPSALANNGEEVISASAGGGSNDVSEPPARRAANDAKPIPLYVQRKLLNASELIRWAKDQGFKTTLEASDMHVTVLYSRTAVDPIKMGNGWGSDDKGNLTVKPGGPRAIEKLGESAVVLLFASDDLSWRHRGMVEAGASHDYDEYQPHVTLTYDAGDVDLEAIKPFTGGLRFGPELFEPLNLDWKAGVTEA